MKSAAQDYERRVQELISKTPEERLACRQKLNQMLDEYRRNRNHGLAYYDALQMRFGTLDEAERRLAQAQ